MLGTMLIDLMNQAIFGEKPIDDKDTNEKPVDAGESDDKPVADAEEEEEDADAEEPPDGDVEEPKADKEEPEAAAGTKPISAYEKKLRAENMKRRLQAKGLEKRGKELEKEIADLKAENEQREKDADRAKMKEVDRLKAEKEDSDRKVEQKEAEIAELTDTLKEAARTMAIKSVAAKLGFVNPADAVVLIEIDWDLLEPDDKGNMDTEDIEVALSELLERKPYLKAGTEKQIQAKREANKITTTSSDAKAKRQKVQKGEDIDEDEVKKQIRDLNRQGRGDQSWRLMFSKLILPGRAKRREQSDLFKFQ